MKNRIVLLSIASLLLIALVTGLSLKPVHAAAEGEVMFLLDASSSMLITDDGTTTRMDKAKRALSSTLDTIPADVKVGLRFYGSQVPDTDQANGCQDTQLISKPSTNNLAALKTSVANVQAKGWTLMGKALQDIQGDFQGDGSKTVILISDGIDTCTPPDACEIAKNLTSGETKIKVNTVGLLVSTEARGQLNCIASNSGGNYYDINDINRLQETLIALAKREVTLLEEVTVPIEGSTLLEKAPFMLANTAYTDRLVVPEELYYAYDALPAQEVTITFKATNLGLVFKPTDYIRISGYNLDTGKALTTEGISGNSESFNYNQEVLQIYYKVDTGLQGLTKPTKLAFKIKLSSTGRSFDGTEIPLEMKITTKGGQAVDHQQEKVVEQESQLVGDIRRTFITAAVMITLLAAIIYVIHELSRRGVFRSEQQ